MNVTKQLVAIAAALLASTVLVLSLTFFLHQIQNKQSIHITTEGILEEIQNQYFIVTKTAIINQSTEIVIDEGSRWSNLLWGQTIEASALIRIDIGIDLSQLTEDNIIIDERNKTIAIELPEAAILDASQFGDIQVDAQNGILKFLLDRDPNEDHNLSLSTLIEEATKSIEQDEQLFEEARTSSTRLLELIVNNLGYELLINSSVVESA